MEIKITVNVSGVDPIEIKVDVPDEKCVVIKDARPITPVSENAVFFDENCLGWTNHAELNKIFLIQQQEAADFRLRKQGYLFLNDVYDMLGIPRTARGQVVGWVYNEGDRGYVDFGIFDNRNADFINGKKNTALLDFNVRGNVLMYL